MMTAARMAIPKLVMTNASPINHCVSISVIALMTNKKRPKLNTVTGKVRITRIGFTIAFMIDNKILAIMAAPTPDKKNDSVKYPDTTIRTTVLTSSEMIQLLNEHPPYLFAIEMEPVFASASILNVVAASSFEMNSISFCTTSLLSLFIFTLSR